MRSLSTLLAMFVVCQASTVFGQWVDVYEQTFDGLAPGTRTAMQGLSMWDRAERLAACVRQRPTLLILDGVEPLQSGEEGVVEKRAIDNPVF